MKKLISNKMKIIITGLCLISIIAFTGCSTKGSDDNTKDKSANSKVKTFKNFETKDIDGNNVNQSIFKENKVTVINIWSTSCPPCIGELPTLQKLSEELKDKKVGIKGFLYELKSDSDEIFLEDAKSTLKEGKVQYQQLLSSKDLEKDSFLQNLQAVPTTLAVDSEGNVVNMTVGAMDYNGWKDFINQSLKIING